MFHAKAQRRNFFLDFLCAFAPLREVLLKNVNLKMKNAFFTVLFSDRQLHDSGPAALS